MRLLARAERRRRSSADRTDKIPVLRTAWTGFVWGVRTALRLTAVVFLIIRALAHLYIAALGPWSRLHREWHPEVVAALHLVVAALHGYALLPECVHRSRRARMGMYSRSRPYRWYQRNLGYRGRYFHHVLVAREVLEIVAQTFWLLRLSRNPVAQSYLLAYGVILSLNCCTALTLLSSHRFMRRDVHVLLDTIFDMLYGVVLPLGLIVKITLHLLDCDGVISQANNQLLLETLTVMLSFFVSGPLDLFASLFPLLSAHLLLAGVEESIQLNEHRATAPHPQRIVVVPDALTPVQASTRPGPARQYRSRPSRLREAAVATAFCGYGLFLLVLVFAAAQPRCEANARCEMETFPLDRPDTCLCAQYVIDCDADPDDDRPFGQAEVEPLIEAAAEAYSSSLRVLNVTGCGLDSLPPTALGKLDRLWQLYASHNRLDDAGVTAVGLLSSSQQLYLLHNRLTVVPPVHERLLGLNVGYNEISSVEPLVGAMPELVTLSAPYNNVSALSCAFLEMPWVTLQLEANDLGSLPDCARAELAWPRVLGLGYNNISVLPPALLGATVEYVTMPGTPFCDAGAPGLPAATAADVCREVCSPECTAYELGDGYCDYEICYSEQCGWDEGDCESLSC